MLQAWNWVLEMYGFCVGVYRAGLQKELYHSLSLLAHPPFDSDLTAPNGEPFYLLHLTYPMKFNQTGAGKGTASINPSMQPINNSYTHLLSG